MLNGHGRLLSRWSLLLLCLFISNGAIAAQYRVLGGVKAEQEEAPYLAALLQRAKSLRVGDSTLIAQSFSDSNEQPIDAPLSYCGYGFDPCEDAQDKVCLIARGTTTFDEKVANCAAGGGVGAIIYNYLPHVFLGAVGSEQPLPVLAVSSLTGQQLLEHIGESISFEYDDRVNNSSFFCGGSYLGDNWLLTAAHCVADRRAADIQVALGAGDYRDGRDLYQVKTIATHQDFDSYGISLGSDVALLKLAGVPESIRGIDMVDLAEQTAAVNALDAVTTLGRGEQNVVVAGGIAGTGSMTYSAYTAQMHLVDRTSCEQAMTGDTVEDDMICAGGKASVGTCFGDSGGPLVWSQNGQERLIGVVSWGVGCGLAGQYDVFASVASYRSAIDALMQGQADELRGVQLPVDVRQDEAVLGFDAEPNVGTESEVGAGAASWWLVLILLTAWVGLQRLRVSTATVG